MPKKPNFLIIQTDQLAPQALPMYSNGHAVTPHLQALSDQGVVFENAYCNFPLCVPSRASTLSGRLAHHIGVWDNAAELSSSIPTLPHFLRAAGYYTMLCGKMHFIGPDQLHGFSQRAVTDIYPSTYAWTADWQAGQHHRPTGINLKAVVNSGVCTRSLQLDYDEEVAFASEQAIYDLVRYQREKPFMLWVSFTQPHSPYLTTQEYWDLYDHDHIPMPDVEPIPVDQLDQMSRWLHYGHGGDLDEILPEHVRTARHAYYGMCSYIDSKIGRLVEVLKNCKQYENTVIIFISDHGEMLGERGMWFKQYFYEWSSRVPLIIHNPTLLPSQRINHLVSLLDLVPTLLDYAGYDLDRRFSDYLQGNSLKNLVENKSAKWDNVVISEFTGEGVLAPCRMLRRDNHKLIYTHTHPPLLYNLEDDPLEVNNLATDVRYRAILDALSGELLSDWDPSTINEQCLQSQRDRLFIHQVTGGEPNWSYLHRVDDDRRYVRNASAIEVKTKARL